MKKLSKILGNQEFIRLADEYISQADFEIYLKVKERMMMQDILINIDAINTKHIKGVNLLDVYNSYSKIRDINENVYEWVREAFQREVKRMNLKKGE